MLILFDTVAAELVVIDCNMASHMYSIVSCFSCYFYFCL